MGLLDEDYKSYGLDYKQVDGVVRRNLRVVLPDGIYQNVLETFQEYLEALRQDLIQHGPDQKSGSIESLLRLMLYAKLFVTSTSPPGMLPSSAVLSQSPMPTLKRMLTDLRTSAIWKIEDVWIQIAKVRAKHIAGGHYKE